MSGLDGIRIYCADDTCNHVGLLTVTVAGIAPEDVGAILDADFGIAVRTGLHCAPLVHRSLNTFPHGSVRFSLGPFNTDADIDHALNAMTRITGAQAG